MVPTIVQYGLHRWICREKNAAIALDVIRFAEEGTVVPLDTPLALLASELPSTHGLAMADAVVTARQEAVDLVTCDAHFEVLPGVKYLSRS